MYLLKLSNGGGVSLEFNVAEWPTISGVLSALGEVTVRNEISCDVVRVGDVEFLLTNDWDEPCLISRDAEGGRILEWISNAPSFALKQAA